MVLMTNSDPILVTQEAMSRKKGDVPQKRRMTKAEKAKATGMCLRCGHKITFAGAPFTAEIKCHKCNYINTFEDSQQPVSGRQVD